MSSGCGCNEAYIFPHITYPYSSCICSFFAAVSHLLFIFLNVFRSCNYYAWAECAWVAK